MVSNKILTQCYHAYVESILTFPLICRFGSLNVKDKQILNSIAKQCSKITGNDMVNLTELNRKTVLSKALKIEQEPSHSLHAVLEWLPSNKRMRAIRYATNRFKNTFFPTSIMFINENNSDLLFICMCTVLTRVLLCEIKTVKSFINCRKRN